MSEHSRRADKKSECGAMETRTESTWSKIRLQAEPPLGQSLATALTYFSISISSTTLVLLRYNSRALRRSILSSSGESSGEYQLDPRPLAITDT
jgi:hypothetical protein